MKRNRNRLELEDHRELGQVLKAAREGLLKAFVLVSNTYGVTSPLTRQAEKAFGAIDELRNRMDSRAFVEHSAENNETLMHLYYGQSNQE